MISAGSLTYKVGFRQRKIGLDGQFDKKIMYYIDVNDIYGPVLSTQAKRHRQGVCMSSGQPVPIWKHSR